MTELKNNYSGSEIKKILFEKNGVPDFIYQTSLLFYNEIIKYLSDNKDKSVNRSLEFVINGDFVVGDFKFNESKIEFIIDYSNMYDKKLTMDYFGNISSTVVDDKFNLKTLNYSIENNKTVFSFNYDINYTVKCIHILKYFLKNKNYIISSITHELKHRYDDIKIHFKTLKKVSDYKGYNYKSTIPSIDYLIHGLYYTSKYEAMVKNSEFYSLLKQNKVTKNEFYDFLIDSEMYKTLKFLSNLNLNMLIDNIKKLYMKEVDSLLFVTNLNIEAMTDEEKINVVLKLTYIGIHNLKMEYLNNQLNNPINIIVNSYLTNDDFYKKEMDRLNNINYIDYFNKKIKDLNFVSKIYLKKLSKLYDIIQEQRIFKEKSLYVKPVKWID